MILEYLMSSAPPAARSSSLENPQVPISDAEAWENAFGTGWATEAGQTVTHTKAVSLAAVWSAVQQISGDVSKLPLGTFRKVPGAKPQVDESHYLFPQINPVGQANRELSALKLWRRAMVHALLWQNACILCDWQGPRIAAFYNFLPDRTALYRHNGKLYVITEVGDHGQLKAFPYEQVIHIEGLTLDGLAGEDLVQAGREDFAQALAGRQFTSKFFKNNLTAGGILQVPPGAPPKARQKVEKAIADKSGADQAFKTLVLRDNFKWHSTQVNPEAAQLVELDEAKVRDVARRFLLSPARLGVSESISYNSLEAERRGYHETTLAYWLSMIRAELNTKCLTAAGRRRWLIDYNVNLALLWADAQTLASIAVQGINARDAAGRPLFTVDEARAWFNLPPHPEPPADPPPADEDEPEPDRAAFVALLAREMQRLARRLNVHAQRAAKACHSEQSGRPWGQWLEAVRDVHGDVAVDSLTAPLAACRAAGWLEDTTTATAAAGALLSPYLDCCQDLAARCNWADLLPEAEAALARFAETTAAEVAALLIKE